MAPEVIKGEDTDYLIDFWSLGVIGFEFLTGALPFNDETPEKVFHNILYKEIPWPEEGQGPGQMHPDARDLLQRLMCRDPRKRLGAKHGCKEIKEHPWFESIEWEKLHQEIAPWVPGGKENDMTNFPKARQDDFSELINDANSMTIAPQVNVDNNEDLNGTLTGKEFS